MKTMNLRDANQQFSKLVREIEETGEPVLVLRNGKPAIKLSAIGERSRATPEQQEEAKGRLMDPGSNFTFPDDWKFNREEIYADALSRPTRQVNESEVNQQLVEQVEQTGETIEIMRDGKPAAELRPLPPRGAVRVLTAEQKAALESLFETARRARPSDGIKMTRDEMHER
jgi:antitoxin (DNA-binding transcriptional repressor) of toxin-antitoxin stability system